MCFFEVPHFCGASCLRDFFVVPHCCYRNSFVFVRGIIHESGIRGKWMAFGILWAMQCLIDFVLLLAGICGARYCFRGAPERPPMKVICLVGLIRSLVLKSVFSRCVLFVVCLIFERTIFDVYLTD